MKHIRQFIIKLFFMLRLESCSWMCINSTLRHKTVYQQSNALFRAIDQWNIWGYMLVCYCSNTENVNEINFIAFYSLIRFYCALEN